MNKCVSGLLTGTDSRILSLCLLLLRVAVGMILFVVGAGKVLGWFGGMGMETTIQSFAKSGISPFFVYLSSYTEFIGGALLIVGSLTRPTALAVTINMLVATIKMMPNGFFFGGAAYPFIVMIVAVVVLLAGPMAYSVDAAIASGRRDDKAREADGQTVAG